MELILIINRYKYLLLAVLLFGAGWYFNGLRWESKYADQLERARDTEQALQETVDADAIRFFKESQRAIDERDAIIYGLRDRAKRMPEASRANCAGASGRELSRQDAEFLVRFAADADLLRNALGTCYDYADAIQESYRN
jgi:hypothetical protein